MCVAFTHGKLICSELLRGQLWFWSSLKSSVYKTFITTGLCIDHESKYISFTTGHTHKQQTAARTLLSKVKLDNKHNQQQNKSKSCYSLLSITPDIHAVNYNYEGLSPWCSSRSKWITNTCTSRSWSVQNFLEDNCDSDHHWSHQFIKSSSQQVYATTLNLHIRIVHWANKNPHHALIKKNIKKLLTICQNILYLGTWFIQMNNYKMPWYLKKIKAN